MVSQFIKNIKTKKRKNKSVKKTNELRIVILVPCSFLAVTVPAVNWAPFLWLEWHFCIRTAVRTLYLMHGSVLVKTSVSHAYYLIILVTYEIA